jgi:hypothetical protein
LENVVCLEGHIAQENGKRRVAPLENVVCPKGHVAQGKQNEASGTLGAPSAS